MSQTNDANPSDLIAYWFSPEVKQKWFAGGPELDAELAEKFGPWLEQAKAGGLREWAEEPESALALIILLDQIPRNIHRGTPDAFACDSEALELTKASLVRDFDGRLPAEMRHFLYMPLMHSEDLGDQQRGVELFEALGQEEALDYMKRHRDVIARFGRFPHRNAILGRQSTEEEIEFLKQPGSSF
jgi:uncharacterized protein (DUF924 family)